MKRIIALGASNSKNSINKKFAYWAASKIDDVEVELIDLNNYEMPLYSSDLEKENGIPEVVIKLKNKLDSADGFVISFAEHNGNYTAAFKNLQDWLSRIEIKIWGGKPTLLLAAAPGKMGGKSVLNIAKASFPYMGANVVADFSLGEFYKNFNDQEGIIDTELLAEFKISIEIFAKNLKN
ncbi:MAG: NAD(P)H-dependent oxidoreductase [Bacteroidota bacterium]|nr:NAD(P)H-dependent oxidoreductase [Bacteroidota bacterium]